MASLQRSPLQSASQEREAIILHVSNSDDPIGSDTYRMCVVLSPRWALERSVAATELTPLGCFHVSLFYNTVDVDLMWL